MARSNRFVDRLCHIYEGDESYLNIPIMLFGLACDSLLGGYITADNIATFFAMSTQEQAEWNSLIGVVTSKSNTSTTNLRDRAVNRIKAILCFYEIGGIPGYTTPDEVWAKLMAV